MPIYISIYFPFTFKILVLIVSVLGHWAKKWYYNGELNLRQSEGYLVNTVREVLMFDHVVGTHTRHGNRPSWI